MTTIDPWYLTNLVCPRDHESLRFENDRLSCPLNHEYPVVEGIPVMLLSEVSQTMHVAKSSLERAWGETLPDQRAPELYLECLGADDDEKAGMAELSRDPNSKIDPVVSYIVAATNGIMYKKLVGRLKTYPVPELRLPRKDNAIFVDLGCNWGRWCIAAARKGYSVVGIDPSLGAIMAARRVARQLGLPNNYVVADARYLPFRANWADVVFAYSVLQHFSKENAAIALGEAARVLKPNGTSVIQMPTTLGLRCLFHQAKRGFRKARGFEVRYWGIRELKKTFGKIIGKSSVSVDCYFGIGIQTSDFGLMPFSLKIVTVCSEAFRALSRIFPFLVYAADSVYVESIAKENG